MSTYSEVVVVTGVSVIVAGRATAKALTIEGKRAGEGRDLDRQRQ